MVSMASFSQSHHQGAKATRAFAYASRPPPTWSILRLVSTTIPTILFVTTIPASPFLPPLLPRCQTFPPLCRRPFSPSPHTAAVPSTIREMSYPDQFPVGLPFRVLGRNHILDHSHPSLASSRDPSPLHHPISHSTFPYSSAYLHSLPLVVEHLICHW